MRTTHISLNKANSNDVWDEHVWNSLLVLQPVLAVLLLKLVLISEGSVDQDDKEENREEPWQWRSGTTSQTPNESLSVVSGIVWLSSVSPPSVNEEVSANLGG